MKKVICIAAAIFCTAVGIVQAVEVRTNVADVFHDGVAERIGSFTLSFVGDEVPTASKANPIYIRIRTIHSRGWAKTLVDLRPGSETNRDVAINLALFPDGSGQLHPDVPRDAVQLVRLIKGEKEAWVKISYPTTLWGLGTGGAAVPPSAQDKISFSMGLSGYNSIRDGSNTLTGGNEPDGALGTYSVTSTELYVDYNETPFFAPGDLDSLDLIAFSGSRFVEEGTQPSPGTNTGIGFSNDTDVARGSLYVARYEFHNAATDFDAEPHQISIGRADFVDHLTFSKEVPPVYFTNTSDFEWEAGTRLFLCLTGFRTEYIINAPSPPINYPFIFPDAFLFDEDINVQASVATTWTTQKLYLNEEFVGYELTLVSGELPSGENLRVDGLLAGLDKNATVEELRLQAAAYVLNNFVTEGELLPVAPKVRTAAVLEQVKSNYYRQIIPYTGYDNDQRFFKVHIVNNGAENARVTALLYNRHGLMLRVKRNDRLPALGKMEFSILDEFGPDGEIVLSWIEVLSDQPLSAMGVLENPQQTVFDAYPGQTETRNVLFAPHLPFASVWETKAYVISADPYADSQFSLMRPDEEPLSLRNILLPGSTAVLTDQHFSGANGRSPWFMVAASEPSAAGILLFDKQDQEDQLASVPLNMEPATQWEFDHLGNVNNGWANWLVVFNPNAEPVSFTITGHDNMGDTVSVTRTLAGLTREALALEGYFGFTPSFPWSRLSIAADQNVVPFLLMGRDDYDMLTTIPGNPVPSDALIMPYVPANAEKWLGLALYNPGEADVQVEITAITPGGDLSTPFQATIGAAHKETFLLDSVIPDLNSYSHVLIRSTGNLRGFGLAGDLANTQLATISLQPRFPMNKTAGL